MGWYHQQVEACPFHKDVLGGLSSHHILGGMTALGGLGRYICSAILIPTWEVGTRWNARRITVGLQGAIVDLMPGRLVRTFAAPYIAGKGIASGVAKADELHAKLGLYSTVDLLAEEVFRREDVEATVQVYLRMIEAMKDRPYASISLKPTSLGINESEAYCRDNLRRIVAAASPHGLHITLDMEDRNYTDVTLRMFKAVREEFSNLGVVLQSRLFRTRGDIQTLHAKSCKVRIDRKSVV